MSRIAFISVAAATLLAMLPASAGPMPWVVLSAPGSASPPPSGGPRQLSSEERKRLRQQVRESERERQQTRGRR